MFDEISLGNCSRVIGRSGIRGFNEGRRKRVDKAGIIIFSIERENGAFCDIGNHGGKGGLFGRLCKTRVFDVRE